MINPTEMNEITSKREFGFTKPAIYKIKVQGDLNTNLSDQLGGLQIIVKRNDNKEIESVLIGQINDQSALSGVLNTLYELHFQILSVSILEDYN
jgi:hypothetical protein